MVQDLAVDDRGRVTSPSLPPVEDPGPLARDARKAGQAVAGVRGGKIPVAGGGAPARGAGARPGLAPGAAVPPPPTPVELPHLGKVLAVSSGKGGVGKSSVSVNLAAALALQGRRVGLMDADIYGPNIPRMMGVDRKPEVRGGKIH